MTVNSYRPQVAPDPLLSAQRERSWRVELLDRYGNSLGVVGDSATAQEGSGVTSWTVTANDNSTIGLTGNLKVRGNLVVDGTPVDWSLHRFRIWEVLSGVGEWPLGELVPALPSPSHNWRDTTWDVELTGKLKVLGRDFLTQSWAAGTSIPVTEYIDQRLLDVEFYDRAVTASAATLAAPIVWPSGTSKLTLANELAGAIGYRGIRADPFGTVRVEPYLAPRDRPVVWTFQADGLSLLTPDWAEEWNLDTPNVVLVRSQELENGTVLEAVAEDWDQSRPSSLDRRAGERVVHVEEGVEVATQAAAQAHADRRLSELVTPAQRLTVTHLAVPTVPLGEREGLWVGSVVRHVRPGHDVTAVVEELTWTSGSPLCQATWRRV